MRKKILVFGATGQVGSFLTKIERKKSTHGDVLFEWIPAPRDWDLTLCQEGIGQGETENRQNDLTPWGWKKEYEEYDSVDYIVNLAAYTAVDKAEEDRENAWAVNGVAPGFLAKVAADKSCPFIHISTDYVFGADKNKEEQREDYYPWDSPSPLNYYGESKTEGEKRVLAVGGYVLRSSWVWGSHGFVDTMRGLALKGISPRVVNDQWGRPTYAGDLAEAIATMLLALHEDKDGQRVPSLLHYSNSGSATTWYEVAQFVFHLLRERKGEQGGNGELSPIVTPCSTAEYPTIARRPNWSVLDIARWRGLFGDSPAWQQSIRNHLH